MKFKSREGEVRHLPENIKEVETQFAKYNIVYSTHDVPNKPETIQGVDGVVLERLLREFPAITDQEAMTDIAMPQLQYHDVLRRAAEDETPVFFVDLVAEPGVFDRIVRERRLKAYGLVSIEAVLALGLIGSLVKDTKEPMGRRKFLGVARARP